MRRHALAAVVAVAAFGALGACSAARGGPAAELRAALDVAYPRGWRYATLAPHAAAESRERPGSSPAWIAGDFDGDGRSDYAAQVVVGRPGEASAADSAQLVVALLRRARGFERHVLSVGGGPHRGAYLEPLPRGEVVADFEGRTSVTLRADAVHQLFAGEASVAYVYDRGRWLEILTGD